MNVEKRENRVVVQTSDKNEMNNKVLEILHKNRVALIYNAGNSEIESIIYETTYSATTTY